jgi:hypothetical protein
MTTIDNILKHLQEGRVTRGESIAALARLITPANVTDIMAALPADVAAQMERWAYTVPAQGGVVVGANLSGDEAQRIADCLEVAGAAIREWASRRDGHASGDENAIVRAPPTTR